MTDRQFIANILMLFFSAIACFAAGISLGAAL